jgi:hypothetical protein
MEEMRNACITLIEESQGKSLGDVDVYRRII